MLYNSGYGYRVHRITYELKKLLQDHLTTNVFVTNLQQIELLSKFSTKYFKTRLKK